MVLVPEVEENVQPVNTARIATLLKYSVSVDPPELVEALLRPLVYRYIRTAAHIFPSASVKVVRLPKHINFANVMCNAPTTTGDQY